MKKLNGKISKQGYRRNSPDNGNDFNIIPSGRISMSDVPHMVYGIDNLGNEKVMYPGQEYQFPGNQIIEIPMNKKQLGGGNKYDASSNFALDPSYLKNTVKQQKEREIPMTAKQRKEIDKQQRLAAIKRDPRNYHVSDYINHGIPEPGIEESMSPLDLIGIGEAKLAMKAVNKLAGAGEKVLPKVAAKSVQEIEKAADLARFHEKLAKKKLKWDNMSDDQFGDMLKGHFEDKLKPKTPSKNPYDANSWESKEMAKWEKENPGKDYLHDDNIKKQQELGLLPPESDSPFSLEDDQKFIENLKKISPEDFYKGMINKGATKGVPDYNSETMKALAEYGKQPLEKFLPNAEEMKYRQELLGNTGKQYPLNTDFQFNPIESKKVGWDISTPYTGKLATQELTPNKQGGSLGYTKGMKPANGKLFSNIVKQAKSRFKVLNTPTVKAWIDAQYHNAGGNYHYDYNTRQFGGADNKEINTIMKNNNLSKFTRSYQNGSEVDGPMYVPSAGQADSLYVMNQLHTNPLFGDTYTYSTSKDETQLFRQNNNPKASDKNKHKVSWESMSERDKWIYKHKMDLDLQKQGKPKRYNVFQIGGAPQQIPLTPEQQWRKDHPTYGNNEPNSNFDYNSAYTDANGTRIIPRYKNVNTGFNEGSQQNFNKQKQDTSYMQEGDKYFQLYGDKKMPISNVTYMQAQKRLGLTPGFTPPTQYNRAFGGAPTANEFFNFGMPAPSFAFYAHGGESDCPECNAMMLDENVNEMKSGGNWIQSAVKHPGRCTPGSPNYDCPKGSPQWNLAQTFKKHHGFHKKQDGGGTDGNFNNINDAPQYAQDTFLNALKQQTQQALAKQEYDNMEQMHQAFMQSGGSFMQAGGFIGPQDYNPTPYSDMYNVTPDMQWQSNANQMAFQPDNSEQQYEGDNPLGLDLSSQAYQPKRQDIGDDSPEEQFNNKLRFNGETAANYEMAGMNKLSEYLERKQRKPYEDKLKQRQNADAVFTPVGANMNSRGDYDVNSGMFRPDQMIPVQNRGYAKFGGGYQSGGEYHLDDNEIENLRSQGYTVEYLD